MTDLSRYDLDSATAEQVAREKIEEWVYATDPHGYCHERPVFIALLAELATLRADLERARQELAEVTAELYESRRLQGELIAQIDEVTAERDHCVQEWHRWHLSFPHDDCPLCATTTPGVDPE